jgi:hypothetical protein
MVDEPFGPVIVQLPVASDSPPGSVSEALIDPTSSGEAAAGEDEGEVPEAPGLLEQPSSWLAARVRPASMNGV